MSFPSSHYHLIQFSILHFTGTTAAGLRAGKPTWICPFFGDQFFWGEIERETDRQTDRQTERERERNKEREKQRERERERRTDIPRQNQKGRVKEIERESELGE